MPKTTKRKQLSVPEWGRIDHTRKLVDFDTWAEAGGSVSIYARAGYRPDTGSN